jgi:hypothetical protein
MLDGTQSNRFVMCGTQRCACRETLHFDYQRGLFTVMWRVAHRTGVPHLLSWLKRMRSRH